MAIRTKAERMRQQRRMTPEEKLRDTEIEIVRDWARRHAPLAIEELRRRNAENKITRAQEFQRSTGLFLTQAEALRHRRQATDAFYDAIPAQRIEAEAKATQKRERAAATRAAHFVAGDAIIPDHDLDIGV